MWRPWTWSERVTRARNCGSSARQPSSVPIAQIQLMALNATSIGVTQLIP